MAQAFGAVHHICTLGDAMCYAARQTGRRIHQRRKLYKASCCLMALQADAQQLAGALGYRMYRYQSGAIHAPKANLSAACRGCT